jgi:hypothetical protein
MSLNVVFNISLSISSTLPRSLKNLLPGRLHAQYVSNNSNVGQVIYRSVDE